MADPLLEELGRRLEALASGCPGIERQEIIETVRSVMASVDGDLAALNAKLCGEIELLGQYIVAAKAEIAALHPDEITEQHLPCATDELEAIVGATEHATNAIFEAVEAIEGLTARMPPDLAQAVTESVTKVYEACSFQDITGQRITKVVTALQHIEAKVEDLLEVFGDGTKAEPRPGRDGRRRRPDGQPPRPDEHLMNGPAKSSEAVGQEDIDALLASLD